MRRAALEHILRAAGAVTRVREWIVLDATSDQAELYAPEHAWAAKMLDLTPDALRELLQELKPAIARRVERRLNDVAAV